MTHVESDRSMELFERMLEVERERRRAWLEHECAGDRALFAEVWRLYEDAERDDGFLVSPIARDAEREPERDEGREIGAYRLIRRLGSGGMGAVWLAERMDGAFDKHVALKLVKRGMDTDAVIRRFRVERQVLADLEHPRIARLLDGGTTPEGLPFLVMEHVEGRPLLEYCHAEELSLDKRLRLFQKICAAVQHAHEQHVVHRDLKPANVLVDAAGEPKLLDFGIARVLETDEERATLELTRTGERFLSPRYASPEQLRGEPAGQSSDVYSLGVILFELLTGRHPHGWNTTTWREFEEEVLERDPVRPSRAVLRDETELDTGGGKGTRRARSRSLRGDLDTIVLTALRKEPERRYSSARELAHDIGLHLTGRPVKARPDTLAYRTTKYVRRNRGPVIAASAFVFLLSVALAVTISLFLDATRAEEESSWLAYVGHVAAAENALLNARVGDARLHLEQAPEALRGWEWRHLASRVDKSLRVLEGNQGVALALDRRRGRLAFGEGASVRVVDVESFETLAELDAGHQTLESLSFSADGRWLACGYKNAGLSVFDLEGGASQRLLATERTSCCVCFHPTLDRLFVGFTDGRLEERSAPDFEVVAQRELHAGAITSIVVSPAGDRLATTSWDESARILDAGTLEVLHELRGFSMSVEDADFAPDGSRLVTCSMDGTIRLWDVASGAPLLVEHPGEGFVLTAQFDPSGERILSTSFDGAITLWHTETRERVATWLGHEAHVSALALDDTRGRAYSLDRYGSLRVWSLDTRDVRSFPGCEFSDEASFDPSAGRIANAGPDRLVRIWSHPEGQPLGRFEIDGMALAATFRPDGARLATIDERGRIHVLDPLSGNELMQIESDRKGPVPDQFALAYGPAGRHLLRKLGLPWVDLLDAETVALKRRLEHPEGVPLTAAAFGPDGKRVATTDARGHVFVWDVVSGGIEAEFDTGLKTSVARHAVAFHPAGELLAAGYNDGEVVLLDLAHPLEPTLLSEHTESVASLAFHPDGSRLVSGSDDRTIRVWDVPTRRYIGALTGHTGRVNSLQFSHDGRTLLSCSSDATVRLWETVGPIPSRTGEPGG